MTSEPTQEKFLSFKDHCSKPLLDSIRTISLLPESALLESLYQPAFEATGCRFSRWLIWCIFAGLVSPEDAPEKSLERLILLKQDYEQKKAAHLKGLAIAESSDVDNPLSSEYRVCFELETKNQINIDLVRMSFKREQLAPFHPTLFNILYVWGFENSAIGYRQGRLIRDE